MALDNSKASCQNVSSTAVWTSSSLPFHLDHGQQLLCQSQVESGLPALRPVPTSSCRSGGSSLCRHYRRAQTDNCRARDCNVAIACCWPLLCAAGSGILLGSTEPTQAAMGGLCIQHHLKAILHFGISLRRRCCPGSPALLDQALQPGSEAGWAVAQLHDKINEIT